MSDLIIYTKTGCPYCAAAMKSFDDDGRSYTEYNIFEMPEKKADALKASDGQATVPIIVDGGVVTVGFGGG